MTTSEVEEKAGAVLKELLAIRDVMVRAPEATGPELKRLYQVLSACGWVMDDIMSFAPRACLGKTMTTWRGVPQNNAHATLT